MGFSALSGCSIRDTVHLYPTEKPTMMWPHFGYRFPFVAKIERGKGTNK